MYNRQLIRVSLSPFSLSTDQRGGTALLIADESPSEWSRRRGSYVSKTQQLTYVTWKMHFSNLGCLWLSISNQRVRDLLIDCINGFSILIQFFFGRPWLFTDQESAFNFERIKVSDVVDFNFVSFWPI